MTDLSIDTLRGALTNLRSNTLQSLLLAVFHKRTQAQRPRDVRRAYARRFCIPSDADPRALHAVDGHLFDAAQGFELLELSPLAPLGVCTAVGPVDPMKIVATVRNLEVTSDPTNVLALEAASRRQAGTEAVHLGSSHRTVRAQSLESAHHRAHFRLFVLCSMFPSRGSGRAEAEALLRHLRVYQAGVEGCGARLNRVSLSCQGQPWEAVRDQLVDGLSVPVDDQDDRIGTNSYYQGLSFKAHIQVGSGDTMPLGDGGFTSWGAQYLSRAKERTLISALGTEVLAKTASPGAGG